MLSFDEGVRAFPYDCGSGLPVRGAVGKITIGIGHNLEAQALPQSIIEQLFEHDLAQTIETAKSVVPNYHALSETRQLAIVNLIFNLGGGGFAKFKNCIAALERKDFAAAASHLRKSLWYSQVKSRAERVCKMIEFDYWPKEYA